MKTYRLKLKLQSSYLTPWHADTLFGSLCWVIAWREGDKALKSFLYEYKTDPSFILSDGMPGDLLPAPVHLSLAVKTDDFQKAKKLKKVSWLMPQVFDAFRRGVTDIQFEDVLKAIKPFTTLHSSINRLSGTTGSDGSLFELEEYALDVEEIKKDFISVYIKIKERYEDKVLSLFNDLSLVGFGKKKSVGKGSFELFGGLEPFGGFGDFEGATGFVSLSHFVPSSKDPTEGFYKTKVKYGKLGGEFTFGGNPFKRPLLMLAAGSALKTEGQVRPYYGRIVEGIAPAKPEVVQYGYAFAVPAVIRTDSV